MVDFTQFLCIYNGVGDTLKAIKDLLTSIRPCFDSLTDQLSSIADSGSSDLLTLKMTCRPPFSSPNPSSCGIPSSRGLRFLEIPEPFRRDRRMGFLIPLPLYSSLASSSSVKTCSQEHEPRSKRFQNSLAVSRAKYLSIEALRSLY